MSAAVPIPPLVWPLDAWPDIDRQLWHTGMDFSDLFAIPHAAGLAETTINNARKAHGRFLAVLAEGGVLDWTARPADRLTRQHARLFVRELVACGNTHNTINARVQALFCAMRIMEPKSDFKWLIENLDQLTIDRRDIAVIDSRDLEAWGVELMERASASLDPVYRQIWFRNGLMITILATLAPRLRALSSMQLGKHAQRTSSGGWDLWFPARAVKTQRLIDYPVPQRLWSYVDRYVDRERKELLDGKMCDSFWIGKFGEKLGVRAIEGLIRRASEAKFGEAFGTHRFRHALATTAAYIEPTTPGLAASILGISERVVTEHYDKVRNHSAFERFQSDTRAARLGATISLEEADEDEIVNHLLGLA